MQRREAFRILGVRPNADLTEIRSRYRELVKRAHPDALAQGPPAGVSIGSVLAAYQCLTTTSSKPSARPAVEVIELGRVATQSRDQNERIDAIAALGASSRYSAIAYLKQLVFDDDPLVAAAAIGAIAYVPGSRIEDDVLLLFSELSSQQKRILLVELNKAERKMPRVCGLATSDSSADVRAIALEYCRCRE